MEKCVECHVRVEQVVDFCPLCGAALEKVEPDGSNPPRNRYPDLNKLTAQYNFMWRLCAFLTIFGCLFSVLVNLLVNPGFLWCLIVIAAALYCWATIPPLLVRGANFAKRIVFTVILTAALVIVLDMVIGYLGWSVNYVLPSLLGAGILATCTMAVFNRTRWAQYVLYQCIVGVFGFVPLLLYVLGVATSLPLVLITAGLALASLLVTIVFGDRTIKNEFIKRFHV